MGRTFRQLAATPGAVYRDPAPWGPYIAGEVASRNEHTDDIYLLDADGRLVRDLTSGMAGREGEPTWSSDGREVAFIRVENGEEKVWIVNVDGSNSRRLTSDRSSVAELEPAWRPAPQGGIIPS